MKNQGSISRQTRWQREQQAAGNCVQCGSERGDGSSGLRCKGCLRLHRLASRRRHGSKPWRQGKPGRPPIHQQQKEMGK